MVGVIFNEWLDGLMNMQDDGVVVGFERKFSTGYGYRRLGMLIVQLYW